MNYLSRKIIENNRPDSRNTDEPMTYEGQIYKNFGKLHEIQIVIIYLNIKIKKCSMIQSQYFILTNQC